MPSHPPLGQGSLPWGHRPLGIRRWPWVLSLENYTDTQNGGFRFRRVVSRTSVAFHSWWRAKCLDAFRAERLTP